MECEDGEFGLFADEDIVEEIAEEKLTEEKTSAYLAKPNHCPYCDSRNIEAGALAAEDNIVLVSGVKCLNCHKTWSDVYTLTRIIEN
jgi:transposase-like protein